MKSVCPVELVILRETSIMIPWYLIFTSRNNNLAVEYLVSEIGWYLRISDPELPSDSWFNTYCIRGSTDAPTTISQLRAIQIWELTMCSYPPPPPNPPPPPIPTPPPQSPPPHTTTTLIPPPHPTPHIPCQINFAVVVNPGPQFVTQ